ncbi:CRISPR-associated endoribonuclease Cas6 [Aneurinibacillus tyrosinisolvens]|uniref:CRISPR-associated endoribonuclease Cas6 n=1 Tax=Aneurinibacillus tyrosinisolvens TaxID=1443435 RepID=UPI00063EE530|nr:CRISPR-associated endoribonuclease Cas6 [Aneurinibacillus tyrosinisolvens]
MKLRLTFKIDKLPVSYRLGILSIIKECIRRSSEDFYTNFFEVNKAQIKPFTFSTYFKKMRMDDEYIYAEQLDVTISSSSYEFIMHLFNGSQDEKTFTYRDFQLRLIGIRMLQDKKLTPRTSAVVFRLLSPLLLENKQNKPVLISSPDFENELNYICELTIKRIQGRSLRKPIRIQSSRLTKQVVKEAFHLEDSPIKTLYFTAQKGWIQLEGHYEDLQCLYDCGIGHRTQLGFGLVEVEEVITG